MRGRLQVCHTHRSYRRTLREGRLGDAIFVLFLGLMAAHWYFSERSLQIRLKP